MSGYKIKITSYEQSPEGSKKILSHCFYGDSLQEVISYAKSHLITDYFFSSTFVGAMKWGTGTLNLEYEGKILNINEKKVINIFKDLEAEAHKVHHNQQTSGMTKVLSKLTK